MSRFSRTMILLAAALPAFTIPAIAQNQRSQQKPDVQDQRFLKAVTEGGMLEVRLGQIVMRQAWDDSVKAFGQRMVADHTRIDAQLGALASKWGITVPGSLEPKETQEIDRISNLSSPILDQEYIRLMVSDHEKDLAEFRRMSREARDADLRSLIDQAIPVIEQSLSTAKAIDSRLNPTSYESGATN